MRKLLLGTGVLFTMAACVLSVRAGYTSGSGYACETYTAADGSEQVSSCWATRKMYILE